MKAQGSAGLERYEQELTAARRGFDSSYGLGRVMSSATPRELLELFLAHFCAQGVGMTEPVEGWIRRAGERCCERGLKELGEALVQHARHEAGHHLLMIHDTRALVARWNARRSPALDAEELLLSPRSPGVERYVALHERVIASSAPYGQIAIEYEIEMMSTRVGPPMITKCVERLGKDVLECLSFIGDHVALDVGHTQLNVRQLGTLLAGHPDFLETLVQCGQEALAVYSGFMDDCMRVAEAQWERLLPDARGGYVISNQAG